MSCMSTNKSLALLRAGAAIFLVASSSAWARPEAPELTQYMNCARGLGVAIDNRFVVLRGERSGERGLYLYTDQAAFFLPLGAPGADDGQAQEFFLRTKLSNVGDILFNYRDKKPGSRSNIQPGISYQTLSASAHTPANYRATLAYDALDEQATYLLRERLREKVATIKNFIDDKNRYSTPAEAKRGFDRDRAVYMAKLERCRIDGDRRLSAAVAEEMQKLETAFPGVTIWEKEVGASLASLSR